MRKIFWLSMLLLATLLIVPSACKAPAQFEVISLDVSPQEVTAGEPVNVTAVVRNVGGTEGVYAATLTVDGATAETKSVTVAPGDTKAITFPLVKGKAGAYQVAIDSLISTLTVKEKVIKKIVIDGVIDEWPSRAITIPDSCGDVSDQAKSKKGVDLKTVWALMEDDYLYVAVQLCDAFDQSLLRNYFIGLDLDKDKLPDYDFGVRPYDYSGRAAGQAWVLVFGRTGNKSDWFNENNWEIEEAYQVVVAGKLDTGVIEVAIPREVYQIPDSVLGLVRVTEGGPNVDFTKLFEVTSDKGK